MHVNHTAHSRQATHFTLLVLGAVELIGRAAVAMPGAHQGQER